MRNVANNGYLQPGSHGVGPSGATLLSPVFSHCSVQIFAYKPIVGTNCSINILILVLGPFLTCAGEMYGARMHKKKLMGT